MPEDESQAQFSVTIRSNGDGTYSVSASDSDDPAGGAQDAQSADEACQIAMQMLEQEGSEDQGSGDAPIPADQQKAVWDQMAKSRDKSRM
jgi:acyl-homoserine lactone acylase PvdQ